MLKIDNAILTTDKAICKNINLFDDSERGLLSQNILSNLRNFIEYIAQKAFSNGKDVDPNDYENKKNAWEFIKTQGQMKFLSDLHKLLQISVSHYTLDENSSERLMLKYYEYLLKIKDFLETKYKLNVLNNIEEFPISLDKSLSEYYEKISDRIIDKPARPIYSNYQDRYYIQKIKPFFVKQKVYYEVTFTIAGDKISKFDRIIAFTHFDILNNYAVKLKIRNDTINILDNQMPIKIIDAWEVSIRNCELKNFAKIFNLQPLSSSSQEYINLMQELTRNKINFVDIVQLSDNYYTKFKEKIKYNAKTSHFLKILDRCRKFIRTNAEGSNVIRYLLYKLNNKVIKKQYNNKSCNKLSNLYLECGCIPFDEMPFTTSLINHNPKIADLFDCLDSNNREHEFLARLIKNNTEQKEILFTKINEITGFKNIQKLKNEYNNKLYYKHKNREIIQYKEYLYLKEYVDNCIDIISKIKQLSTKGVDNYTASVNYWLKKNNTYQIDCNDKLNLLKNMFSYSQVSLIYGSAGTGKSTLINHISSFWFEKKKIYLANTNPAVNNLKRKVLARNSEFMTITKFLSPKNDNIECDLLIIDECSTVSNSDMKCILEKATFKLLILVGDIFQIEAILFGNWFNIIRNNFLNSSAILKLTKPYRTTNKGLLKVWENVRNLDVAMLEPIVKNNYSVYLDNSLLSPPKDDEIILCLNYDGIYGINNVNYFLQSNNRNPEVIWNVNTYKVGDPILFNESERFAPLIYNNMKGKILKIEKESDRIFFTIELEVSINSLDQNKYPDLQFKQTAGNNSVVRFSVNKRPNTDDEENSSSSVVPFQVAYAVSIHKAQGLEYRSVKIVITNEVEEMVSHSIFYTAITRAKEELKIYWTPETEKAVLANFKKKDFNRDSYLLRNIINNKNGNK